MIRSVLASVAYTALIAVPATSAAAQESAVQTVASVPAAQHAQWTELLQKYVSEDADGVNRFDYGALKANADDVASLKAYLASFADLDFDALDDDEAFVAWGNLYNA
ncbi:MAG: hypothetical protein AAFQ67_08320, partial [Pseudomonadota bacterium]